jgi:hypothetical protein
MSTVLWKVEFLCRSLPLAVLQLPDLNEQSPGQSGGLTCGVCSEKQPRSGEMFIAQEHTRSSLSNRANCIAFRSVRESKTIKGLDLYKHFVPPALFSPPLVDLHPDLASCARSVLSVRQEFTRDSNCRTIAACRSTEPSVLAECQ